MKKKNNDYTKSCALCEYSCHIEFDDKYICKYKNRCTIVDEMHTCRKFKFDLLKVAPHPRLPYEVDGIESISVE